MNASRCIFEGEAAVTLVVQENGVNESMHVRNAASHPFIACCSLAHHEMQTRTPKTNHITQTDVEEDDDDSDDHDDDDNEVNSPIHVDLSTESDVSSRAPFVR